MTIFILEKIEERTANSEDWIKILADVMYNTSELMNYLVEHENGSDNIQYELHKHFTDAFVKEQGGSGNGTQFSLLEKLHKTITNHSEQAIKIPTMNTTFSSVYDDLLVDYSQLAHGIFKANRDSEVVEKLFKWMFESITLYNGAKSSITSNRTSIRLIR